MTQEFKNAGSVVNAQNIAGNVNNNHRNYWNYCKIVLNSEQKSIYFGVKSPDPYFTGRALDLKRLKTAITTPRAVAVVTGLGGIGKTQLVRKFIEENQSEYQNVIWIDSQRCGSLEEEFKTLAKDSLNISIKNDEGKYKDIATIVEQVLSKLSESKTLIVLDNVVEEPNIDTNNENVIKMLLNMETSGHRPHIIITSRIQEWSDFIYRIKLEVFDSADSFKYVSKTLNVPNNKYNDSSEKIMELVEKLQSLPLALRQATAHINYQRVIEHFFIDDYIEKYKTRDFLDWSFFEKNILNTYEKTTFTTWRVTLDAIRKNGAIGAAAIRILYIISYFDYSNIPRDIFFNLTDVSKETPFILNILLQNRKNKVVAKETVQSAVRLLANYSMIDSKEPQTMLSIHRLVQEVIKIQLNSEGQTKLILLDGLSLIRKYENIQEIHEHAILAFISASMFNELVKQKELMLLPAMILKSLISCGKYSGAKYFVGELSKLFGTIFREDHPNTDTIKFHIADLYRRLGKHSDALQIFQKVFKNWKYFLGENHLDTLLTEYNIGLTYSDLENNADALKTFEAVFDKLKHILDENHPHTLVTKSHIANSYHRLGKLSIALRIFKEILENQKNILGKDDPDLLLTKTNIAYCCSDLGEHYNALQILEEVLEERKKVLGEDHLQTLVNKSNIAYSNRGLTNHSKALQIYEEVFEKRKSILGEDHPDTLDTKSNIGLTNAYLGKDSEALKIFLDIFDKQKNIFGEDHLDTIKTMSYIAHSYQALGKHIDALEIFQEIFEKQKKILGDNHPHTLDTKSSIGKTQTVIFQESFEKRKKI